MLEEALLLAQVAQMGSTRDFDTIVKMGTYNPARALGLANYGLDIGCEANLVLINACSAKDAIVSQSTKAYIIKEGRVVATNYKTSQLL